MLSKKLDTPTLFLLARNLRSAFVYAEIRERGLWLDYCNDLIARGYDVPPLSEQISAPS